ncbi:MAG TPA: cobyric acid synthase [Microvirga sp.]|jgi:adenosylcobyric acid synthase
MSRVPAIMIQGTGSNVGKSLLVAGLCRHFARQGLAVRPFKPQNMSNNAAAVEGGEIGRAQALQARAACVAPHVHMNPVLLKPETDRRSQIIVQGRRFGQLEAASYGRDRGALMPYVLDSFGEVGRGADLVIVEGAGSPAETNLRRGDIANMGFAQAARVPVVLAGDIDRGGVIASLVGTHAVLAEEDRALVRAFLINRFRGDVRLFDEGVTTIERLTGWPSAGVVPWFAAARNLPAEDALDLASSPRRDGGALRIACPILPRIANFDDLDPLKLDPAIALTLVPPGRPLPADADLVILPGSKATVADLAFLKEQGWDIDLKAHHRRGGRVLGLCGGYQMLGRTIADPDGIEGVAGTVEGLGLLAVDTVLTGDKTVRPVTARHAASGENLSAYEIHLGRTEGPDTARAPFRLGDAPEGAASADGRVVGTYLHGLFATDPFRRAYLEGLRPGAAFDGLAYDTTIEGTLDDLADHLAAHLDIDRLLAIARAGL